MEKSIWRNFDWAMFACVLFIALFGVAMVYSATSTNPDLAPTNPALKQLWQGVLIGVALMFVMARLDYHLYESLTLFAYLICIALLSLVRVSGTEVLGAKRWIDVGPIQFQPSELAKFLLIIVLARYFTSNGPRMWRFSVFLFGLLTALPAILLVLLQPDLGTTIVLVTIWFTMTWASGADRLHVFGLIFVTIPLLVGVYLLPTLTDGKFQIIPKYQYDRLHSFVDPNFDPDERRNLLASRDAVINGELWGQGYLNGQHNKDGTLSIREADFIFSVVAEEFGMVGCLLLLLVYGLVLFRIIKVAQEALDPFGRFICIGVLTMLGLQIAINVGMNLGMLPVTGITLPLVSAGNTSIWTIFIGLGVVESVAMRRKRDITWYYRTGATAE